MKSTTGKSRKAKAKKSSYQNEDQTFGRPTKYNPKFHIEDLIRKSKLGWWIVEVTCSWNISKSQFYEWGKKHPDFQDAIKKANEYREAFMARTFRRMGLGKQQGNLGALIFYAKNTIGWRDVVEVQSEDFYDSIIFVDE